MKNASFFCGGAAIGDAYQAKCLASVNLAGDSFLRFVNLVYNKAAEQLSLFPSIFGVYAREILILQRLVAANGNRLDFLPAAILLVSDTRSTQSSETRPNVPQSEGQIQAIEATPKIYKHEME